MYPRLLGDVGGTHARFGWQAAPGRSPEFIEVLRGDAHAGLAEAAMAYLAMRQLPAPAAACMGIANPITGDDVHMTNRAWSFSTRALAERLGLRRLKLINDFTALALALPQLHAHELRQVGGRVQVGAAPLPMAVIGPGTGLGVGGLLPGARGGWVPISGEGGHVTLAAHNELQWRLLTRLARRHGHVSAERVLSGPGLGELHQALQEEQGLTVDSPWPAPRIVAQALEEGDANCLRTLELFAGFLGSVAGDLALTLGARGGLYLGGGIVPRLGDWFVNSGFRAAFEAKGRFAPYLQDIAVWVIASEGSPALRGAALALEMEDLT